MCWGDRFRIRELEAENITLRAKLERLEERLKRRLGEQARDEEDLSLGGRPSAKNAFPGRQK